MTEIPKSLCYPLLSALATQIPASHVWPLGHGGEHDDAEKTPDGLSPGLPVTCKRTSQD